MRASRYAAIATAMLTVCGCNVLPPTGGMPLPNETLFSDLSNLSLKQHETDPCLMVLADNSAELPTYDEAIADAEARAARSSRTCETNSVSLWRIGTCGDGAYRFIANGYGDFISTMYFDSATHRLVGITELTDAIRPDDPCGATTYKITRVECDDFTVTRTLCP